MLKDNNYYFSFRLMIFRMWQHWPTADAVELRRAPGKSVPHFFRLPMRLLPLLPVLTSSAPRSPHSRPGRWSCVLGLSNGDGNDEGFCTLLQCLPPPLPLPSSNGIRLTLTHF
ncbi:hypothetical protein V9T40_012667 [Parthenolecanium corni]|uniref:Uncharacterized protein n=1 Tax=Parthenolecanium corni TaxID=536013 RepID=A0AAN9TNJ4_9HEMI